MTVNLCTRSQVKDALGITTASDDIRIDALLAEVTQEIMRFCGREFVPQATAARTFAVRTRTVDLAPYDLRSATLVELHPEAGTPTVLTSNTDYALSPVGGAEKTGTYLSLRISETVTIASEYSRRFGVAQVRITGDWGVWDSEVDVSEDINRAAIETVAALLDRPAAQVAGYDILGQEPRPLSATGGGGWSIPASARRKLQPYRRASNLGVF